MSIRQNAYFKIVELEAKELLAKAELLGGDANETQTCLNDIWDEALRQLWKKERQS